MSTRALHLVVSACILSACSAGPKLEALKKIPAQFVAAETAAPSPFVEGYLEYVGPPDRWAGPQTLVIHLTAKDPELARLAVTPPIPKGFAPISQVSAQVARDSLAELASAIERSTTEGAGGCLFPLRVKLLRVDGSMLERQGCRTLTGWPVALNLVTDRIFTAAFLQREKALQAAPVRAIATNRRIER